MRKTRLKSRHLAQTQPLRSSPKGEPSSRDVLLKAAKRLFARKGLSGTTIRDIADEAGMNSSQISYYFDGKEGLYRACIQNIAEDRIQRAREILLPPSSQEEYRVRLRLFIDNFFNFFLEDRDTGLIIIRESDRLHSPAEKIFRDYFSQLFELLIRFFKTSLDKNLTSRTGEPLTLASLFIGALISELRLDHMKENLFRRSLKSATERRKVTDQIVEIFS